jgi:hypothetical protein
MAYIFLILTLDLFVEREGGGIHRSPNSNFYLECGVGTYSQF